MFKKIFPIILVMTVLCFGQMPKEMTYQGILTDNVGSALTGTYQLTFRFYNVSSGSSALWTEIHGGVVVNEGLFKVILGTVSPLNLSFDEPYWIGVQVESDPELDPRMKLTSVGYSFQSMKADSANNISSNVVATDNIQDGAVTQAKLHSTVQFPVNVTARLSGDGSVSSPLDIDQQGAASGQVLEWNGSSWAPGTDDSGGTPSGTAGGDLSGTYPDPTVAKIQNYDVSTTAPSSGQVLEWDGSAWAPGTDDSGGTPSGTAGGDLSGTYPNPTVASIQNRDVFNAAPSDGQVLKWINTNSRWEPDNDESGGTPSGTAGGDLTGTYPNPTVDGLRGRAVATTAPSTGQVLEWNGSSWAPGTDNTGTGNTLDQAYDQGGAGAGRTINADAGAVNITGSGGLETSGQLDHNYASSSNALHAEGSPSSGIAMYFIRNNYAGSGYGISAGMNSTSASASSYGIAGWNYGLGYGIYGWSLNSSGFGTYGINSSTDNYGYLGGPSYGSYGYHNSGNYGYMGGSGVGVYGYYSNGNYGYLGGPSYGAYANTNLTTTGTIGSYSSHGNSTAGTNYYYSSTMIGALGRSVWGSNYHAGVQGTTYANDSGNRTSGVHGIFTDNFSYWGALAYQNSASTNYGVYATGGYGSPLVKGQASVGIGIGSWGGLFGADIHGKIYGVYAEGTNYALYSNGTVFKNDLDVHLQDTNSSKQAVLYTNVSTDVTIQTSGYSKLSNGKCQIEFDENFKRVVSQKVPVVVTVTPIGNSKGIYISKVESSGFSVVENDNGKSNVDIAFIAIGRRAGFENPNLPEEVVSTDYTNKLARGLHNDADTETSGEGLYYENGKLYVGQHASVLLAPDKSGEKIEEVEEAVHGPAELPPNNGANER